MPQIIARSMKSAKVYKGTMRAGFDFRTLKESARNTRKGRRPASRQTRNWWKPSTYSSCKMKRTMPTMLIPATSLPALRVRPRISAE